VSHQLCAYRTPDEITGEHHFMRLEQGRKGNEWRNKLHRGGRFCDVVCNVGDQTVRVEWNDKIEQLPITRCLRTHYREISH